MVKDRRLTRSDLPSLLEKDQRERRRRLEHSGELIGYNRKSAPLENLIFGAATCLYDFFHANGYMIRRSEWDQQPPPRVLLNYVGWVYAFYGSDDRPIYVGETGRELRLRFMEHSRGRPWWPDWKAVKVMPCPDRSMRKVFESLIGLAGGYEANVMQPTGVEEMFKEVILSLLILKNDAGEDLEFPNKQVGYNAQAILDQLES